MKILLFGPQNAGKTSLMQTTCNGYDFMKVTNLRPTKGISRENFIYRGAMQLNIWDAGGQERYMERYFSDDQRASIFSEVTTPIFMIDTTELNHGTKDKFSKFLESIFEYSPEITNVYVLLNKIDLPNSKEDVVHKLLTDELSEDIKKKLKFTPVSVKIGSAQHRLIEILDSELQKSTMSMQKLGKIKHILSQLKTYTLAEYLLFNLPDGLLITSTFSAYDQLKDYQLQYLKLERNSIDSSLENIYRKSIEILKRSTISSLAISTIVYESDICFIILKEVTEGSVILAITDNKNPKVYSDVMNALENNDFKNLKESLRSSGY